MKDSEEIVVLLHGLGRGPLMMSAFSWYLRQYKFKTHSFSYPSRKPSIQKHAESLRTVVDKLMNTNEYSQIHFVSHSMGCLVIQDFAQQYPHKLGRAVFLGPPLHGSQTARWARKIPLVKHYYQSALDEIGDRIAPEPDQCLTYGIIAGGTGLSLGFLPWLSGDNDGLVTAEESKWGNTPWYQLRLLHPALCFSPKAMKLTRQFITHGDFLGLSSKSIPY